MIYKIFGLMLIIFSSYIFGVIKSNELKGEFKLLNQYKTDLIYLKNNLGFSRKPILDLIEDLLDNGTILNEMYTGFIMLSKNKDFKEAWLENLDKFHFSAKAKRCFQSFPDLFGVVDSNGQIDVLENHILNIANDIDDARCYFDKNEKLLKNTGLYIGILTAVLLI